MHDMMHAMKDAENILKDYEAWLRHQAYIISPSGDQVDDLIQEGRIAMWKALEKYDPSRGPLSPYLVTVAYFRMGLMLKTQRWTGSSRASMQNVVKYGEPSSKIEEIADSYSYLPDNIELSYHQNEIHESIKSLSPRQREYVVGKFWEDKKQRDLPSHGLWDGHSSTTGAKTLLKNRLQHLEGAV